LPNLVTLASVHCQPSCVVLFYLKRERGVEQSKRPEKSSTVSFRVFSPSDFFPQQQKNVLKILLKNEKTLWTTRSVAEDSSLLSPITTETK
jgi:hypothetical protein